MSYVSFMGKVQARIIPSRSAVSTEEYCFMLAVASDTLIVLDRSMKPVEIILKGSDVNVIIFSFSCQDDFLDTFNICKNSIASGINPVRNMQLVK